MISLLDALSLIISHRPKPETVNVPLLGALGARCAQDVAAKLTMPPFDASAMDGYAVRHADASDGAKLTIIGEAPAGAAFDGVVGQNQAVRIFTGGPMPLGADTVVIQENVIRDGETITIETPPRLNNSVRKAGIDFANGDVLIAKGETISPAHIALAASGNHDTLPIYRPLNVALIANGDELVPPGSPVKTGQIVSSNADALSALIQYWGGQALDLGIAVDSLDSISEKINAAKDADIIVPIGGASVGDYDYMKRAFTAAGYETIFAKIAVKPGKPTWFGKLGKQLVLGLPGNPASANVCAHLCLKTLLGVSDGPNIINARLDRPLGGNGPRETYLRGRLYLGDDGLMHITPFPKQDSSLITPLAAANALVQLKTHDAPRDIGDKIGVYPLGQGPDIFAPQKD